jgi:hypothetical protein
MNFMRLLVIFIVLFPFRSLAQEAIPYFQNDDFASHAFAYKLNAKELAKKYSGILLLSKKPIKNNYTKTIIDTIYTFSKDKTKFEIYHSKLQDILQSAYIDTDKIILRSNVKVGMRKSEFEKIFKIKIAKNTCQIGDLEQNQVYTFSFKNNILVLISYTGYIE